MPNISTMTKLTKLKILFLQKKKGIVQKKYLNRNQPSKTKKCIQQWLLAVFLLILLSSVTISSLLLIQPVNAQLSETNIFINPDGSISGTDKIQKNGDVYTIASDLSGSVRNGQAFITILKNNVVLDGAGHTLTGTGTGIAILIEQKSNITVKNVVVYNFGDGIDSKSAYDDSAESIYSTYHNFVNNSFTATYWGISMDWTNHTVIADNTINALNSKYGVSIHNSNHNVIKNNTIINGSISIDRSTRNTFIENTINGRLFVLLENVSDQIIDGAGQVILYNCNNMTIRNINPYSDLRAAIQLFQTNSSEINFCSGRIILTDSYNNKIYDNSLSNIDPVNAYSTEASIKLVGSQFNEIYNNQITLKSQGEGIYLEGSHLNKIFYNTITGGSSGIKLMGAKENAIYENKVHKSANGIDLTFYMFASIPPSCINNSIYKNIITQCDRGINLYGADKNCFYVNNITASVEYSIYIHVADENKFYNNNIEGKAVNVYEKHEFYWGMGFENYYSVNNTWDAGSQIGGNYWNDYNGTDANNDGIGDTPYIIDANNTDHYPLIKPFNTTIGKPEPINETPTPTQTPLTTGTPSNLPTPSNTITISPSPTIPELSLELSLILATIVTASLIICAIRKRYK